MGNAFVVVWSGTSRFLGEVVRSKLESENIPATLLSAGASDIAPHHNARPEWEVHAPAEHKDICAALLAETETAGSTVTPTPFRARVVGWIFFAAFIGIPAVVVAIRLLSR